jgi:RNA polymerase sigma-70 factor (ECF subfamily)
MDHFRAGRRWQPESDPPEDSFAPEVSAEDEALHGLGQERMLLLIEDLSDDQRQVLTLKYAFDFSNGEVAGILGKTEGAVKALQHRAFATLHRSLSAAHVV